MTESQKGDYPNTVVFSSNNSDASIRLYDGESVSLIDSLLSYDKVVLYDMFFTDQPYFLPKGCITCHSGKMANVNKGKWDKSNGKDENHKFNLAWLSKYQNLLKPNGTIWVSGTHHVIYSVDYTMRQLGMKTLNNII